MKFTFTTEHLYWWPVAVPVPNPDPNKAGTYLTQEFKMQFAAEPLDQARAAAAEIAQLPAEDRAARQHEKMMAACRDWNEDVVDEAKVPVPFSPEALAAAMQAPWFRLAVYRAYDRSLSGEEARKGN